MATQAMDGFQVEPAAALAAASQFYSAVAAADTGFAGQQSPSVPPREQQIPKTATRSAGSPTTR
ncbi:MAG: hypothetical protein ABI140_08430 [Jatrophihabitantaceae bacterium]